MDLLKSIDEQLRLREEVEAEILAATEERKAEEDKTPRLGLEEALPGGYERAAHARGGEFAAAQDLQVGADQARKETQRPAAAVKTRAGKNLPVNVHHVRQDGSVVFELNKAYYLCPGEAVADEQVGGRPMKVMQASACQKVG